MKKTFSINLAGSVYHIDEDAFKKLKKYLDALERKFKLEKDVKEIISDIEARIAELFTEKIGSKREVVTMEDVDYVISVLGDPEIISNEENSYDDQTVTHSKKTYRRMYRDPDNRIIGGICSGLAAYWNIDPIIVRVIFIVLAFFGLSGLFIYLILWIIMPEAHSTAQKLEMRGEAVTVDNIKDFIRDEFEQVKKNFKNNKK